MRHALLSLLLLAGCGSPAAPSDDARATSAETTGGARGDADLHEIQLSRPSAPGDTYRMHTVHTRSTQQVVTVSGQVVQRQDEEQVLDLTARVQVREVNARGAAMLRDYEVERLVVRDASGERELLPAGSVIRVTRVPRGEGEGSIELVGGELSEADTELLDMIFSTSISPVGDDGVFGTDQPRRVGERWPIDAAVAARDLNKMPELEVAEDQVSGHTTLEAIEEVNGVECQRIRAELRAEGFAMSGMPEGSTVEHADMTARMSGAFPTDPSLGRLQEEEALEMNMRMRIPDETGREARLEMRFQRHETSEYER